MIAVDSWTKWLVATHIDVREAVSLIPGAFQLVHVRNTGAAFGIGANAESHIVPLLLNIGAMRSAPRSPIVSCKSDCISSSAARSAISSIASGWATSSIFSMSI